MAFNANQIDALKAKLDGSIVKERRQAGRTFSYIEAWHAIAEANRIFGHDAWERETLEMVLLSAEPSIDRETGQIKAGRYDVCYRARVEVRVWDGERWIRRQGCGYGSGQGQSLGDAHESALKEAESDAMKRAMMTFGNPFGLALYDKTQAEVDKSGGQQAQEGTQEARRRPSPRRGGSSPPPEPTPEEVANQAAAVASRRDQIIGAVTMVNETFGETGAKRLGDMVAYLNKSTKVVPLDSQGVPQWAQIDPVNQGAVFTLLTKLFNTLAQDASQAAVDASIG